LAARLEEARPPVDVDALPVDEVEPERVELTARHLHGEAGAAFRILEREEDGGPRRLPAQLGDLALDPDRGEPLQPGRDALVERRDGVDLAVAVLDSLDLAHATERSAYTVALRSGECRGSEENLGGRLERAALFHELDRAMEIG